MLLHELTSLEKSNQLTFKNNSIQILQYEVVKWEIENQEQRKICDFFSTKSGLVVQQFDWNPLNVR